jgi:hypothetical protein
MCMGVYGIDESSNSLEDDDDCEPENITEQVPCIRVKDKYYSISLRMMKAIWRHVRLVKGFVNVDYAKDGRRRLRIPMALYQEKQRTQIRFNVCLSTLSMFMKCFLCFDVCTCRHQ